MVNKPQKNSHRSQAWQTWKTAYNIATRTLQSAGEMARWHFLHPRPAKF